MLVFFAGLSLTILCGGKALFNIFILHVGTMANKGTQALVKTEFNQLKIAYRQVEISVSTTDVPGVKEFGPAYKNVTPTLIDIPYEMADERAKKYGYDRKTIIYLLHLAYRMVLAFLQIPGTFISAILTKIGLPSFCKKDTLLCMKECDLVISTSDENFKEGSSNLPLKFFWLLTWWNILFSRMWDLIIAKKIFGKPVILFPNSVGPFRTVIGRFLGRNILNNIDAVIVREKFSVEAINKLNLKDVNLKLTSDIVLLYETSKDEMAIDLKDSCIGICPGYYSGSLSAESNEKYIQSHAQALDKFIDIYKVNILFIPHYKSGFKNDDLDISKQILKRMSNKKAARIMMVNTVEEFSSILGSMEMVVTSKMHPGVLSITNFVPTLAVVYDYKQSGFFEQLGISEHKIYITDLEPTTLFKKMEKLWLIRASICYHLSKCVPFLQKDIKEKINEALIEHGGLSLHEKN